MTRLGAVAANGGGVLIMVDKSRVGEVAANGQLLLIMVNNPTLVTPSEVEGPAVSPLLATIGSRKPMFVLSICGTTDRRALTSIPRFWGRRFWQRGGHRLPTGSG